MKNLLLLLCSLLLNGVFGDTEVKVSVKEGDSVTLEIKPDDINRAAELVWRFNDRIISKIDLEVKDKPPEYTDERFRDRLNLDIRLDFSPSQTSHLKTLDFIIWRSEAAVISNTRHSEFLSVNPVRGQQGENCSRIIGSTDPDGDIPDTLII